LAETRIDADKGEQIVHLLCEGMGINAVARFAQVEKRTVLNVLRSAGQHCVDFLGSKLRDLKPTHVEIDEVWTFVKRKQRLAKDHPVFGDQYVWLALDEPTKLIITWQVSKRTGEAANRFIGDLRSRVTNDVFDMTTDGFRPYRDRDGAVFQHFGHNVNYATEIKQYGTPIELKDARRYSPPVCIGCRRWLETGARDMRQVTVNHAERQNLNVRLFNRRFTRLTLGFSKKLVNLEYSTALMVAFHNFCRPHKSLYHKASPYFSARQVTPAMAAGLTDHVWSVAELLAAS